MLPDKALLEDCRNAASVNTENLLTILQDNQDTAFGKAHGFSEIRDTDAYRAHVPLSCYADYADEISAMRRGETMRLTAYPLRGYCQTSGTLGTPKYIPMTDPELERYSNYFMRYQDSILRNHGGKRLHVNTFRTVPGSRGMEPLLFTEIYYRYMAEAGLLLADTFAGGLDLLFDPEPGDILYAKVWAAFAEPDIRVLESNFMYDLLNFFGYLEQHGAEILRAMRERRVPETVTISAHIRERLESMEIHPARLAEVEQAMEDGFERIAPRLWKRLTLISGVSNHAFFTEDAALKRYVGDVSRFYLCYAASECYIGFPSELNRFGYVLMPRNGFYEFLPYGETDSNGQTLLPQELEAGELYELVVTNFAGLYRYRMGDIVRIIGYRGQSPVLQFEFRKNQALNLDGEKLSILQLEHAMEQLPSFGIIPEQYCFGVSLDSLPGRYLAAFVLRDTAIPKETLSERVDRLLREINADYDDLRRMQSIGCVRCLILSAEDYNEFLRQNGLKGGHNKPKHIAFGGFSERSFNQWEHLKPKNT